MIQNAAFTIATKVALHFCYLHCAWQRGAVENINGLVLEYFPKGVELKKVTIGQITRVQWRLSNRPRIHLDGQSPTEFFHSV